MKQLCKQTHCDTITCWFAMLGSSVCQTFRAIAALHAILRHHALASLVTTAVILRTRISCKNTVGFITDNQTHSNNILLHIQIKFTYSHPLFCHRSFPSSLKITECIVLEILQIRLACQCYHNRTKRQTIFARFDMRDNS